MRHNLIYAIALSAGFLFASSCKKETTGDVSKVVDVTYPRIILKGAPAISIPIGGTATDEGATVVDSTSEGVKKFDVMATSNNIDANTPGLYFLIYTATNSNGFESTAVRPVAVTNIPSSLDISGTYARTSNGAEAHVSKVGAGLFLNDNVGGVLPPSPAILPVYMVVVNDSTILVPEQPVPNNYGTLSVDNGVLSMTPSDTTYSYIVRNPGFGTSKRTFSKQ